MEGKLKIDVLIADENPDYFMTYACKICQIFTAKY
jgi:hypothetical protein